MTINIAFTSYPKRISNCVKVIHSVLNNNVQPDRIYLTLSHLEFPRYEQDLPFDLYRLIMTSNRVILNWVEDNYKSMKKVFPILPYIKDEDIIIDIDDDMELPKDFISSRLKDFKDNGCLYPITSNNNRTMNLDQLVMSAYSLMQKKMLNGYDKFLTPEVLNTFNDDRTYLYLCHMNGYKLKPCTKWAVADSSGKVQKLDVHPRSDYQYAIGAKYDEMVAPVVDKLSNGKKIGQCFNLFNSIEYKGNTADNPAKQQNSKSIKINQKVIDLALTKKRGMATDTPTISLEVSKLFQYEEKDANIKHDLVYVLGKGSHYNNLEIKISITSMLKYCSDWIGDIYVIGENPGIHNKKVKHIQAPDITNNNKDANIINKILTAIKKIPKLSNNFLFCSDDILVTKPSKWSDFAPRYVFEYNQDDKFRAELYKESKDNPWDKLLLRTLDRFIGYREHIYFYEPHIFAPINKQYFKQMCQEIDYTNDKNNIIMSLWFNWLNLKDPPKKFDHMSIFSLRIPDLTNPARHLTYNDRSFGNILFRQKLVDIVSMDEFTNK